MIRLIQRRLIIPRGDTGSFSIPVLKDSVDNIAVFTIFDEQTRTKIFQKTINSEGDILNIAFTHNETVNLKPGKYNWDIKYYSNPEFIDEELVNGEEVDSYYAGFSLPICEIRETADNYLVSSDAPNATLSPAQLDIITHAINDVNDAAKKAQENVEHYPIIKNNNWYIWNSEQNNYIDTEVSALGLQGEKGEIGLKGDTGAQGPKGATGDQGEIGPTPQLSVGTVTTGEPGTDAEVEITGTFEAPVLNFTIPRGDTGNITQAVRYDAAQTLTDAQKEQARANIDAADAGEVADLKSTLSDITGCEQIQYSDPNDYYYVKTGNVGTVLTLTVSTQSRLSKYASIDCAEGDVFYISGTGGGTEDKLWCFIDGENTVLSCAVNGAYATDLTKIIAPPGSAKLLLNTREPQENAKSYKGEPIPHSLEEIKGIVDDAVDKVDTISEMEYFGNLYHGDGTIMFITSKGYTFDEPLPPGTYTLSALVTTDDTDATFNRAQFSPGGKVVNIDRNTRASVTFTLEQQATYVTFFAATTTAASTGDTATWADIVIEEGSGSGVYKPPVLSAVDYIARGGNAGQATAYVSTDGNDETGTGTSTNPYATVNHALEAGDSTVLIKAGTYQQTINLALAKSNDIKICKESQNDIVTFVPTNAVITESETLVDGYTKVYKASFTGTFHESNIWLFQDGVPDAETMISDAERHPLQRGYVYRCHDTRIWKVSATELEAALAEIESATVYKWFYDTESSEIYFSRPETVSENNPICGSFNGTLFSGGYRKCVELVGINVKYMAINFNGLTSGMAKNCKASNVFGAGCYTYNFCEDAVFDCCEAERAFTGTNGDGFNGHGVNTGNAWAKITHGTLIGCWSHDNRDDGFSDHERCESLIIGGLYEYNRLGGGVTPSSGSHTECHNVYARKNGEAGFVYMNDTAVAEGGVGGQMICYDCVAENNTIWEGHTQAGFKITSNGNTGIFVNCKAIGQDNAYYVNNATSKAVLIDCGSKDCQTLKGGSGVFVVKNTSLVE